MSTPRINPKPFSRPTTPEEAEKFLKDFQLFTDEDLSVLETFYKYSGLRPHIVEQQMYLCRHANKILRQFLDGIQERSERIACLRKDMTAAEKALLYSAAHLHMIGRTNGCQLLEAPVPRRKASRRVTD